MSTKPLASLLTARELLRVTKATNARLGHNPDRTKAEQRAAMWETARELYPAKTGEVS